MLNERLAEVESEQLMRAGAARPTQGLGQPVVSPGLAGEGPFPVVLPLPWEGLGAGCAQRGPPGMS